MARHITRKISVYGAMLALLIILGACGRIQERDDVKGFEAKGEGIVAQEQLEITSVAIGTETPQATSTPLPTTTPTPIPEWVTVRYTAVVSGSNYSEGIWVFEREGESALTISMERLIGVALWQELDQEKPIVAQTIFEPQDQISFHGLINPLVMRGGIEFNIALGDYVESAFLGWDAIEGDYTAGITETELLIDGITDFNLIDSVAESDPDRFQTGWDLVAHGAQFARWERRNGTVITISNGAGLESVGTANTAEAVLTAVLGEPSSLGPGMQSLAGNSLLLEELTTDKASGVSYVRYDTIDGAVEGVAAVWVDQSGEWMIALGEWGANLDGGFESVLAFILTRPSWEEQTDERIIND